MDTNLVPTEAIEKTLNEVANVDVENIDPGAIGRFMKELPDKALALGVKAVIAIVVLIVTWQIINLIARIIEKSLGQTKVEPATAKFLSKFVKFVLRVMLLFTLAATFGMDTASIVALLGSAGVAIGLAVQGTLSDFAGGILILLARPFKVGDYIVVGGTGVEGTVTEINLINTHMITRDFRRVVMPNNTLSSATITNNTGNDMRILDVLVGISYSADIDHAREVALEVLGNNELISQEYDKKVFVDELGDSSVVLRVRGFVTPANYFAAKWSLNEEIKKAFDKNGVEIPFPQLDVHVSNR